VCENNEYASTISVNQDGQLFQLCCVVRIEVHPYHALIYFLDGCSVIVEALKVHTEALLITGANSAQSCELKPLDNFLYNHLIAFLVISQPTFAV